MMAALSVAVTVTTWIFAIYASGLLATAGIARIYVPAFSLTSVFCPLDSGPPHAGSVLNTLRLLRFTLIYWWIPTFVALLAGATLRRMTLSERSLGREQAR